MSVVQRIDQDLALATCCASIQTYFAYDAGMAFPGNDPLKYITPPSGWSYRDYWVGQDVFDGQPIHPLVLFGLVFEKSDGSGEFLFAFRGTQGIDEWIDDFQVDQTPFRPFVPSNGPAVPSDALAEDGFSEIYYSMQAALFGLLDKYTPSKLVITGHSLGSSLCTLFTLDVVISRPALANQTMDYASPRTGNPTFATFYDSLTLDKGNATLRVANTKDVVPCMPPESFGYQHVGDWFPVCFEGVGGIFPDLGLRHSNQNYFRTLCHDFARQDCSCRLEPPEPKLDYCKPNPAGECEILMTVLAASEASGTKTFRGAFP